MKEARAVIVPAILLTIGFNLFASNSLDWLRQPPQADSVSTNELNELIGDGDSSALIDAIDVALGDEDTAATEDALTPEEIERLRADSIRQAREHADSVAKARKDSIAKAKQDAANNPATLDPNVAEGKVKSLSTAQVKTVLDRKAAIFIDARRQDQFAEGHIPGSLNIYAYEFADNIHQVAPLPKEKLIVVYCDGGACELSHDLADELTQFGFSKVVIYSGGWEEWSKTDYPKATGE